MKLILKQTALLIGAMVALYGAALALSLLLVPRAQLGQRLDAGQATQSLYMTEPKYVFLARGQLNTPSDKLLLVGASNMQAGFRQAQMQAQLPQAEVHNLSVGGSNITQVGQIVDLVREVQSPEVRRHNTFVIGLWYGLFADDKARWYTEDRHAGDTDIDIERYRYGFYRRTAHGPAPVLPPERLDWGVVLIHPYLVLDRTARDLTRSLRSYLAAKPKVITDEQRNATVISEAERQKYLAFWRTYMGSAQTLNDAPFLVLEGTVEQILADGGRVVLVDMPIPAWHAQGAVLQADYRRRVDPLLARLKARPGVKVVPAFGTEDDDFSDEVHPKPRVTNLWAQRLATAVAADVLPPGTQAASAN
ncbi:hypothetical protein [Rhizobacter sp. Root1221]|uniref:hypothetical protein n=1 Tax=Rhizobacter sp. Root1221 TaxID=1736433 RepID=UPI0006F4234E|nr:hypothetical protein [Rhizobacter sp. Root1221]KQV95867.1 hypothetical protein ASC87_04835 [Rhizobacter sp. Root1221]